MAVKTITIDMEAYDLLARHKRPGQSFSRVIKEHFGTLRTGHDLRVAIGRASLTPETLNRVDELIESRKDHPAPAADL